MIADGTFDGISYRNRLLRSLAPADVAVLRPSLRRVQLDLREQLESPDRAIRDVYFIEEGIASVFAVGATGACVEVGLVGREGMTGLAVLLGDHRSPNATTVQTTGEAYAISADNLRRAIRLSAALHELLLRYVQVFMVQTAHTAIAHARSTLEKRLARWLLMAQDRLGNSHIPVTHEALSVIHGVRRASITDAINGLEGKHRIRASRGRIVIIDRAGLERKVGPLYGLPEAEYHRLIVPANAQGMWKKPDGSRTRLFSNG